MKDSRLHEQKSNRRILKRQNKRLINFGLRMML